MSEQFPILSGLNDADILRIADEAFNDERLVEAQNLMRGELARRGLQLAMTEAVYDASQDDYDTPTHQDEQWNYFVPVDPNDLNECEGCQ